MLKMTITKTVQAKIMKSSLLPV